MSNYVVETFYTCTFKITHKLDELNEKKLSELENRNDGEVKIIDVRLNNRKTKKSNGKKNADNESIISNEKEIPGISSIVAEKISKSDDLQDSNVVDKPAVKTQSFFNKINDRKNKIVSS